MRDSELYFLAAILFAAILTWRITHNMRKTMRAPVRDEEQED